MKESQIEKYITKKVTAIGGMCFKFVSPGKAGVPDRLICHKGKAFFVELKAPTGKPRPIQKAVTEQIRATGMKVFCIRKRSQVDDLVKVLQTGILPQESRYDSI